MSAEDAAKDEPAEPQEFDDIESLAHSTYIQQLIWCNPGESDASTILTCPDEDEEAVWQYDHFRQFCLELNGLVGSFVGSSGADVSAMSEAIGVLDGVTTTLTSEKYFPSRVTVQDASMRKLPGLARKLYKVFEYAHDNHAAEFQSFEEEHHLCARFHTFAEKYSYMDPDDLDIKLK